jgi:diguanylate cyclase (GGDEF)-like protein
MTQEGQEMVCGMVKDISERKEAERNLKHEKEKSEEVLKQLTELSLHYQKELAVHRQTEKQLHHMAMYDPLTELPNRILLKTDAEKMVAIARRYNYKIGCIAVSIDDLDKILASYDQNTADAVVVEMSLNLAEAVRDCDTLGRPDCNRFVVYVSNCQSSEEINLIAHRVMRSATRQLESIQQEVPRVSLGVAIYPDDSQSVSTLLSLAETAKNIAFRDGKHLHFYKQNQATFLPADEEDELKSS